MAVHLGIVESQEKECARMLVELFKKAPEYLKARGFVDGDEVRRTGEHTHHGSVRWHKLQSHVTHHLHRLDCVRRYCSCSTLSLMRCW